MFPRLRRRVRFFPRALGVAALAASVAPAQVSDPRITTWRTTQSAQYARTYETAADRTTGNAVATWPRAGLTNSGGGVSTAAYAEVQRVAYSANYVYVVTSGLPGYTMGHWLTPNAMTYQFWPSNRAAIHRIPRVPSIPATKQKNNGSGGVLVNGVFVWQNGDAQSYNTSTGLVSMTGGQGIWNRLAGVAEAFNFDAANGHHPPSGAYHNHVNPKALRHQLGDNVTYSATTKTYSEGAAPTAHSPILGWANDGLPIYGPYGYASALDATSGVRRMTSGFVKRDVANAALYGTDDLAVTGRVKLPVWAAGVQGRSQTLAATEYGPGTTTTYAVGGGVTGTYSIGLFAEDYDYLGDLGKTQGTDFDLNRQNVRFCVTPEFPAGTYAYFMCIDAAGNTVFPDMINQEYFGTAAAGQGTVTSISETVTDYVVGGPAATIVLAGTAAGSGVALSWNSAEGATYRVESSADGSVWSTLAAAVTSTGLTTGYAATAPANRFRVTLTAIAAYATASSYGTPVGQTAALIYAGAATAPAITTQPAVQTVTAGGTATFAVTASGTAPLSYQWYRDTAAVNGGTAATLTLANTTAAMAGSYSVVVSNSAGSATSATATLTVNPAAVAPTITVQPVSQTVAAGAGVTLAVTASGTAPLAYQWRKDGAVIAGATAATYSIAVAAAEHVGSYAVTVANAAGEATSAAATLALRNAAATDPRLASWLTAPSAGYARLYQTDAAKTAGTTSTTWSRGQGTQSSPSYAGVMQISYSADYVYLRSSGLGYHTMGPWYLDAARTQNFPNFPANQNVLYRIPRAPAEAAAKTLTGNGAIGYGVDGVALFDNRDTFSYANASAADGSPVSGVRGDGVWNRDAYVNEGVTFDAALAHQAGANYHYHANMPALRQQLGDNVDYHATTKAYAENATAPVRHSPILGWMADGFPVYGPYGYSSPTNAASGLRRMVPGYVKRDGTHGTTNLAATGRTTLPAWAATAQNRSATLAANQYGPAVGSAYALGRYLEDYDYLGHLGKTQGTDFDLDLYNGRFCVTPEFPGGTYAYFVAIEADGTPKFPYVIGRWFNGTPGGGSVTSIAETVAEYVRSGPATAITGTATAAGTGVALAWDSVEGATYRIESSSDNGTWTTVAATVTSAGTRTTYTAAAAAAFFRVTVSAIATYDTRAVVGTPVGTIATIPFATTATAPAITAQPTAQTVTAGGTATFSVAASGTAPLAYQWYRDTTTVSGATAATLTLANVTAAMAGQYSATVSNSAGSATSAAATLTVNPAVVAPTVTTAPVSVASAPGGAAVLTVAADGTGPLAYQWLKDGTAVPGATAATLAFPAVLAANAGLYTVRVTNAAGSTTSATAELTVASAAHAVFGSGYQAGGTVTLAQTASFSGTPAQVTWQLLLPAGWTISEETSAGAATKPAAGTRDLAEWSWTTVPASPLAFRCTLNVPAVTTSTAALSAVLAVRRADGTSFQMLAQPEPLAVGPAARFHSADTDQDGRVSLVELTRVIELYNYRAASVRTGQYRAKSGTEDGFAPGP